MSPTHLLEAQNIILKWLGFDSLYSHVFIFKLNRLFFHDLAEKKCDEPSKNFHGLQFMSL